MKRSPKWQQENPKDQLTAILSAIEGNLSNLCAGRIPPERLEEIYERCQGFFREAHLLNAANCRSWSSYEALDKDPDRH